MLIRTPRHRPWALATPAAFLLLALLTGCANTGAIPNDYFTTHEHS
jgi:type IV pilus biogenesis protein CpaD/CtpE